MVMTYIVVMNCRLQMPWKYNAVLIQLLARTASLNKTVDNEYRNKTRRFNVRHRADAG